MIRQGARVLAGFLAALAGAAAAVESGGPPEALSVFEDEGDACVWFRVELPGGARRKLAELPFACDGLRASPGLAGDAVIWRPGPGGSLTLIDERGRASELPLPRRGSLDRVGHGPDGSLQALTTSKARLKEDDDGRYVRYGGRRVGFDQVPGIGTMMLAHAFRWDGARWTEFETVPTSGEACDTLGADALAAAKEIDPEAGRQFVHRTDDLPPDAPLQALADSAEGAWRKLRVSAGSAAAWFAAPNGALVETGLVVADVGGEHRVLETGLGADETVTLDVRGPYVLVDGGGGTVRIFDARDSKLVLETGARASFWPAPL